VAWLGITGIVLLVAGVFAPMFGPMFHRDFGRTSFTLCVIGMAAYLAAGIRRRVRGTRDASGGDDAVSDTSTEFGGHDSHGGGHGTGDGDVGH
jgi:hypothetical protein